MPPDEASAATADGGGGGDADGDGRSGIDRRGCASAVPRRRLLQPTRPRRASEPGPGANVHGGLPEALRTEVFDEPWSVRRGARGYFARGAAQTTFSVVAQPHSVSVPKRAALPPIAAPRMHATHAHARVRLARARDGEASGCGAGRGSDGS
eukprot:356630-Chlamydomonas_euryale.AAC.6